MNSLNIIFADTDIIIDKSNNESRFLIIKNIKGEKGLLNITLKNLDLNVDQEISLNLDGVKDLYELKKIFLTQLLILFKPRIYLFVSNLPTQINLFYLFLNLPVEKICVRRESVYEYNLLSMIKNQDFDGNIYDFSEESAFGFDCISIKKL